MRISVHPGISWLVYSGKIFFYFRKHYQMLLIDIGRRSKDIIFVLDIFNLLWVYILGNGKNKIEIINVST